MKFFLCFIPIFVAIDPIGLMPNFIALTSNIEKNKIKKIIIQSIFTALIVSLVFLFVGKSILKFLGITISDFMIAGGILLFIFSINEFIGSSHSISVSDDETIGAVPIGVPLIAGPGLFTTTLVLIDQYGILNTVSAIIINIIFTGIIFYLSNTITKMIGKTGAKTVSKISSLLLAAIAVMFVRKGIEMFLKG